MQWQLYMKFLRPGKHFLPPFASNTNLSSGPAFVPLPDRVLKVAHPTNATQRTHERRTPAPPRRRREEDRVACFQMRGRAAADAAAEGQYYDGVGMAATGIGEKMHRSQTQDGDTRHFLN